MLLNAKNRIIRNVTGAPDADAKTVAQKAGKFSTVSAKDEITANIIKCGIYAAINRRYEENAMRWWKLNFALSKYPTESDIKNATYVAMCSLNIRSHRVE